jgi:hypothetical protein
MLPADFSRETAHTRAQHTVEYSRDYYYYTVSGLRAKGGPRRGTDI